MNDEVPQIQRISTHFVRQQRQRQPCQSLLALGESTDLQREIRLEIFIPFDHLLVLEQRLLRPVCLHRPPDPIHNRTYSSRPIEWLEEHRKRSSVVPHSSERLTFEMFG